MIPTAHTKMPRKGDRNHPGNKCDFERLQMILALMPEDTQKILDVGCGDGLITNSLSDKLDITALDISYDAVKFIKNRKKVIASIDALPFRAKTFEMVLCTDMLEHIPDEYFLQSIQEIVALKPKYILINTPYKESLREYLTKCNQCNETFHSFWHVRSFEESTLQQLLTAYTLCKIKKGVTKTVFFVNQLLNLRIRYGMPFIYSFGTVCPNCGNELSDKVIRNFGLNHYIWIIISAVNRVYSILLSIFRKKEYMEFACLFKAK